MKNNLTVGIPCYNCSETLEETLQSINIQTFKPYEVLLVDDNSTEDYTNILKKFNKLNIRYIKLQENKGVGFVRAKIVEETKTKYLTMIDADDYFFHVNVLWFFNNTINEKEFDFLVTNFVREEKDGTQIIPDNQHATCHSKVYNVEFLREHNITFPNLRAYEEGTVNRILFKKGNCVKAENRTYFWRYNEKGLTKKEDMMYERFIDYCDSFFLQEKIYKEKLTNDDIGGLQLELFELKTIYGETDKIKSYEKYIKDFLETR